MQKTERSSADRRRALALRGGFVALFLLFLTGAATASDTAGDTVGDSEDRCPVILDPNQPDQDSDGRLDACDNCPDTFNRSQQDRDGDGVGDACDNCLFVANPRFEASAPGRTYNRGQLDDDADGMGNACDADFTEALKDEFVNVTDLLWFLDAYGSPVSSASCPSSTGETTGPCARYDLSERDQFINVSDLLLMIGEERFGKSASENRRISPALLSMNEQLEQMDLAFRVGAAEWVTVTEAATFGQTVYADDRTLQLGHHFVPGDPRRNGRVHLLYQVDQREGSTSSGLSSAETTAAIDRAMSTWDQGTQCSDLLLAKLADIDVELGLVQFILGFGPFPARLADITHGGWMPKTFFDELEFHGGEFILAVTFTFLSSDETGSATDIDGNGKLDVAFREVYYNDHFNWGIDVETYPFDVETVALHEAGHALSQGHFGRVFRSDPNGKLHFAPFAVMNAVISRKAHDLEGTDEAGHCSLWGSWPGSEPTTAAEIR